MKNITIMYPGELGSEVARLLVRQGWTVFSFVAKRSRLTKERASTSGIITTGSLEEAVKRSEIVLSLVPQGHVIEAAEEFSNAVRTTGSRPVYLDGNSISPMTMVEVNTIVRETGADCIDGSFIGSAKMLGRNTTLYLSGVKSEVVHDAIGTAFRSKTLGTEIGMASAFKLAFSGFNKGLVALFLEVVTAGDQIGQKDELLQCLKEFYPGTMDTVERLLPSYPRHIGRRIEEMREIIDWMESIEHTHAMVSGTKNVFHRFANMFLSKNDQWDVEKLISECCRKKFLNK